MHRFYLILFLITLTILAGCRPVSENDLAPAVAMDDGIDPEARIEELGLSLPEPTPPVANYVKAVHTGNLVFLAGHGPALADGVLMTGKVGQDLSLEEGQEAARLTAISMLATLKAELGDLNRVRRVVKVRGMVNSTSDFEDHPQVVNGFSNLIVDVFGERGKHARAAVGMGSLPSNIPIEVEMVVEVE